MSSHSTVKAKYSPMPTARATTSSPPKRSQARTLSLPVSGSSSSATGSARCTGIGPVTGWSTADRLEVAPATGIAEVDGPVPNRPVDRSATGAPASLLRRPTRTGDGAASARSPTRPVVEVRSSGESRGARTDGSGRAGCDTRAGAASPAGVASRPGVASRAGAGPRAGATGPASPVRGREVPAGWSGQVVTGTRTCDGDAAADARTAGGCAAGGPAAGDRAAAARAAADRAAAGDAAAGGCCPAPGARGPASTRGDLPVASGSSVVRRRRPGRVPSSVSRPCSRRISANERTLYSPESGCDITLPPAGRGGGG